MLGSKDEREKPNRVWHTLKGTANAVPAFGMSYFSDLALVLRWLYANESTDARHCLDFELVDCLCRDVALATIFGRNAVVTTAFLPALRITLRT